jgi:uncharacterized delta-60 repeat protein
MRLGRASRRDIVRWITGCACTMLLAVATSAAAPAVAAVHHTGTVRHAGELDASFGARGRVVVPAPHKSPVFHTLPVGRNGGSGRQSAIAPDGDLATLAGKTILMFEGEGNQDSNFGRGGRIQVGAPAGMQFTATAIAFDSRSRLLVAGTTSMEDNPPNPSAPTGYWEPPFARATLLRYLPNGRPDPRFGSDGALTTDFGLPAPVSWPITATPPNGDLVKASEAFHYQSPTVVVTGLTVDAEDKPVVSGAFVYEVSSCYAGTGDLSHGYIARLTANGDPDSSFGGNGVYADPRGIQAQEPTIDASGKILYLTRTSSLCGHGALDDTELTALDPDGQVNQSFGSSGHASLPFWIPPSFTVDRFGRILLLAYPNVGQDETRTRQIMRLRPRGSIDPSFGRAGIATVPVSDSAMLSTISVDERGRPLLAGTWGEERRGPERFLLKRLTSSGQADRRFGRKGSVTTRLARVTGGKAEEVISDHGLITVVGAANSRGTTAVGLTRYRGGR